MHEMPKYRNVRGCEVEIAELRYTRKLCDTGCDRAVTHGLLASIALEHFEVLEINRRFGDASDVRCLMCV